MFVTSYGAAHGVTGSCHMVTSKDQSFLVDCGMFQGSKKDMKRNYEPFGFDIASLDFMVLTHGHIDHCGRIPKLVKDGFRGRIYCSVATADLLPVMLLDSAYIQEKNTEHENRRRMRQGLPPREPLYTRDDVEDMLELITGIAYEERVEVGSGAITLHNAGHIIGSAIVEYEDSEGTIVFSGDLGQWDAPIIKDPVIPQAADCVYVESTYGDRLHPDSRPRIDQLADVVAEMLERGGRLMIPSFAIERTQELIFCLKLLSLDGRLPKHVPVFLDSPLAIKATEVFRKHPEIYDMDTAAVKDPFDFAQLKVSTSSEDSKAINKVEGPCIIIAGSGMCTAGRIRHHLKHGIWDERNIILFVGYQAVGTLGRVIQEGADKIRMMGQEFVVRAQVRKLGSFSAHADQEDLIRWLDGYKKRPSLVCLVHGDEDSAEYLADLLRQKGYKADVPEVGERIGIPRS